jgi:hypothetical protein
LYCSNFLEQRGQRSEYISNKDNNLFIIFMRMGLD